MIRLLQRCDKGKMIIKPCGVSFRFAKNIFNVAFRNTESVSSL